jgi:CheY-like chemotaxis protein
MRTDPGSNRRILIVDDNEDIHRDFQRILAPAASSPVNAELDDLEASLLGTAPAAPTAPTVPTFELTSAYQGMEALARVRQALKDGAPFALAFIDVRMPPGWDGVETLTHLWREDPRLQAVICSAYSDFSWERLSSQLGQTDRFLILKKPFDPVEVRQLASALVDKWNHLATSQRTEQALRGSEARLQGMLQALPDALLRLAADGTCLDFKPSRETPAPQQPCFPVGAHLGQTLPADVAQRMLSHLARALGEGGTHVLEYGQSVGGEARCFEARLFALDAAEALVLVRDITERKRAEAAGPRGAGERA